MKIHIKLISSCIRSSTGGTFYSFSYKDYIINIWLHSMTIISIENKDIHKTIIFDKRNRNFSDIKRTAIKFLKATIQNENTL